MTRIGLISCARQKLNQPAPARELYTSQLFQKSAAYIQAKTDRWYILSALHGLVFPETVLSPYDVRLGVTEPIPAWAARTRAQLHAELADVPNPHLIALAGKQYRTALRDAPWPVEAPLTGLGIGQQLSWLTRELRRRP